MRIIILRSTPVNPDPRVEKEVGALFRLGHDLSIIGWDRQGQSDKNDNVINCNGNPISITRIPIKCSYGGGIGNLWKFAQWNLSLLRKLFQVRDSIDVVHACDFDTAIPAVILKLIFKKKMIYDIFDFYVDTFNVPFFLKGIIRWAELRVIGLADAVILAGEDRRLQIAGSHPKLLRVLINTPVDCGYCPGSAPADGRIRIVYIGALINHRFLLEMIQIVSCRPHVTLRIGGWGPLANRVKEAADTYENIEFLGKVDYDVALRLTAESEVNFAIYDPNVPNHRFSNPNKIFEAMMSGRVTIVARGMGIDRLVQDERCGFVVNYHAPEEVGELLDYLSCNPNIIREFGDRGRAAYESKYSWSKMIGVLAELYTKIE